MKIAIIGQQDFGRAVLEAFSARSDEVVGVFCRPEKEGAKPDTLRLEAQARGLKVFQFAQLASLEATQAMRSLQADLGVMAYVLQFAPQSLTSIPRHGTIQYHPSLLPRHRGPSSISWAIARGERQTGLTVFRPTDGMDEGPVILQKSCSIGPDETLGELYFNQLFPMGVSSLLEAADLVAAGQHQELVQDEAQASYEGWFLADACKINWSNPVDQVYDLIRAANPAPGAWTFLAGKKIFLYDCRKHLSPRFADVKGKPGSITDITETAIWISAQGGQIEIQKLKAEDGKKMSPADYAREQQLEPGHRAE